MSLPAQSTGNRTSINCDREYAQRLVSAGAIMMTPGFPPQRFLVGQLIWPDDHSLVWFTAFGDSTADVFALHFDESRNVDCRGICFLNEGKPMGFLGTIDSAGVEDPDDYRIAWEIWQQVEPLRRKAIEQWCAIRIAENADLAMSDAPGRVKQRAR